MVDTMLAPVPTGGEEMNETMLQILALILTTYGSVAGVGMLMGRLIDRWLKARFDSIEQRMDMMHSENQRDIMAWKRVERDIVELRAEISRHYVRREEIVRIEAKLDGLLERRA